MRRQSAAPVSQAQYTSWLLVYYSPNGPLCVAFPCFIHRILSGLVLCQCFNFNPYYSPFFYILLCEEFLCTFPPFVFWVFSAFYGTPSPTFLPIFFFPLCFLKLQVRLSLLPIFLVLPPIKSCECFPSPFPKFPHSPSPRKTLQFSCFLPPSSLFRICQGLCEKLILPILLFFLHRQRVIEVTSVLNFTGEMKEDDGPLESSMIYKQSQISLLGC